MSVASTSCQKRVENNEKGRERRNDKEPQDRSKWMVYFSSRRWIDQRIFFITTSRTSDRRRTESPRLPTRRRINLDRRHDTRNELQKHHQIKVHPHPLHLLSIPIRRCRLLILPRPTRFPKQPILPPFVSLVAALWCGKTGLASESGLLFDPCVHAFDHFLHDGGVFTGVDGGGLEGGAVGECFDCDGFEGVVCADVLEDLGGGEWGPVLR